MSRNPLSWQMDFTCPPRAINTFSPITYSHHLICSPILPSLLMLKNCSSTFYPTCNLTLIQSQENVWTMDFQQKVHFPHSKCWATTLAQSDVTTWVVNLSFTKDNIPPLSQNRRDKFCKRYGSIKNKGSPHFCEKMFMQWQLAKMEMRRHWFCQWRVLPLHYLRNIVGANRHPISLPTRTSPPTDFLP